MPIPDPNDPTASAAYVDPDGFVRVKDGISAPQTAVGVAGFVPNMCLLWKGLAAGKPRGWVVESVPAGSYLRIATTDGEIGVAGGSATSTAPDHVHTGAPHTHSHDHTLSAHTHTTANHTHSLSNHVHAGPSHTHTGPSHTHGIANHTHPIANHTHTGPSHSHTTATHDHTGNSQSGGSGNTGDSDSGTTLGPSSTNNVNDTGVAPQTTVADDVHTHDTTDHNHSMPNHTHGISTEGGLSMSSAGSGVTSSDGTPVTGADGTPTSDAAGTGATGASGTAQTDIPSNNTSGNAAPTTQGPTPDLTGNDATAASAANTGGVVSTPIVVAVTPLFYGLYLIRYTGAP